MYTIVCCLTSLMYHVTDQGDRVRSRFSPTKAAYVTRGAATKHMAKQMARTQKNKATSFHLGQLKAKLAKLKRELLTPSSGGGGGGGAGFDVARTGVASIGFIGFPSVGKSTLMSRLTGQHSEAAAYEFTTLTSVPGQVMYNGKSLVRVLRLQRRAGTAILARR